MQWVKENANGAIGIPAQGTCALGSWLVALVNELAHGVALVDAAGRLLVANSAAAHELRSERVLRCHGGVVEPAVAANAADLRRALADAAQGERPLLDLRATHGRGFSVAVMPMPATLSGRHPQFTLFFGRACLCDSLVVGSFARNNKLTPAEEQVLGFLCQGMSAPQIASDLHVAVSTVRSHVRSICAKTRCGGVRELVARIAALPAAMPSLLHRPVH